LNAYNNSFDSQLKRYVPLECLDWNIHLRWQWSCTELGIYDPVFLKQEKVSYASTGDA
jgi:hypothetical protein